MREALKMVDPSIHEDMWSDVHGVMAFGRPWIALHDPLTGDTCFRPVAFGETWDVDWTRHDRVRRACGHPMTEVGWIEAVAHVIGPMEAVRIIREKSETVA